jgi:hypothetical protein
VLWSVIAYLVALGLTLFVVVPAMRAAAGDARSGRASVSYTKIAAPSGVSSLLLAVVVVLMVWKP